MTDVLGSEPGSLPECPPWCEEHAFNAWREEHIGGVGGVGEVMVDVVQFASSCGALAGKRYVCLTTWNQEERPRLLLSAVGTWQLAALLDLLDPDHAPLATFLRQATEIFDEEL